MVAQQNTDRIQTTHVGSLPRRLRLLDMMKARLAGGQVEPKVYEDCLREEVDEIVRKQAETGIDILTDGEQSKPGFVTYLRERLDGFEARPGAKTDLFAAEVKAFPEYYEQYFKTAMFGGGVAPSAPLFCVGPVKYHGETELKRDIANLKAAAAKVPHKAVFMPVISPSGLGKNEYYKTEEEYINAVGAALRTEYKAIADAGFVLQIDDPFICDIFADETLDAKQRQKRADMYVEAVNTALKGIAPEQVRYHTCYGINEGPRIHEAALSDVVDYMLKINAFGYSFEAANPRHEHEYHLWEKVKLPAGKVLIPGVITHASNIVEHPELIAERIMRFAKLVGRENVIAGGDCGFSTQANYHPEVHPTIVWAKFEAMREGARLASQQLWS